MNYAWCLMIGISFVCAFFNGTLPETAEAMLQGAKDSVFTLLSFAGILCFWTGILKVGEDAGFNKAAERFFSPVIRWLFPHTGKTARGFITMNLSANLLGMGNAATPMGIKAMEELDRENPHPETPSKAMCLFTILNTTSFTILPTTVIALRAAAGANSPYDVILPIWCVSAAALILGVILVKIFIRE